MMTNELLTREDFLPAGAMACAWQGGIQKNKIKSTPLQGITGK